MSLLLFAKSIVENAGATITTSATAAGFGKERLFDRDRGLLCKANAAGDFDYDIVLASPDLASALMIVGHNQAANVEVYADTALAIGTTLVATLVPTGIDPFYGTYAQQNVTKYRVRFKNFGTPFQAGEVMLGVPRTLGDPSLRTSGKGTVGNVAWDRSPGGYLWAVRKGSARARLEYGFRITDADVATLEAAFSELSEGAKALPVRDAAGTWRWMNWLTPALSPVPVGGGMNDVPSTLEEAL